VARPRVIVTGNLVEDRAADGDWVPGGPALYAARMAHALGAEVTLITHMIEGYPAHVLAGIHVASLDRTYRGPEGAAGSAALPGVGDAGSSPHRPYRGREGAAGSAALNTPAIAPCRYANTYDAHGNRTQLLLSPGEPLDGPFPHDGLVDALIVAPAYHELSGVPAIDARVVMVSLQGPLRSVDGTGRVIPAPGAYAQAAPFVEPGAFACFSDEDTRDPGELAKRLAAARMTVAVTRGHRGATVYEGEYRREVPPLPAKAVDPTGAGDCFATAWAVRFAETGDLAEACAFGLAAGALATEKPGLAGVPTRSEVEERARMSECAGSVA
jgi:hypothetical protein